MHQYKSSNDQITAREMATRTAEHHPLEKQGNDDSTPPSINQSLPSLQSNQPRNKFLAGPLKAPTFVRTTARFDYQPDICKDYKETGFCGFGDTCIYLHDRGDTKSGWEMEREYEEKKKKEEEMRVREVERFMTEMNGDLKKGASVDEFLSGDETNNTVDDGIPFACHICRGPFKDPIVTTCNHYFCESCMSSRIKDSGMGCPVCQKDTHGVLNFPQKLISKKRRLVGSKASWEEFLDKSRGIK
jgi:RING finger protein 113A